MEWKKPDRNPGDDGTVTDEEIKQLQPEAEEMQGEFQEYKKEKTRGTLDIRARLARKRNQVFTLFVDIGDGEGDLPIKVRRMTEKERTKYNKLNYAKFGDFDELTPEDLEKISDQGYEIMAALIVDPKMTVEEWKSEVDNATLNFISNKVSLMTTEMNDAVVIEEFKKKSMTLPKSS